MDESTTARPANGPKESMDNPVPVAGATPANAREETQAAAHLATQSFWGALRGKLASPNIPSLDGLRALSVFLVIVYHFGFERMPGDLGVLAFFVLSGFLITWLLLKENDKYGAVSLRRFYTRRVLRIFPAFYFYWCVVLALLLFRGRAVPWDHAWSAFFYLSNYYNAILGDPNTFVSHTWSLAIEEQFYLLWPAIFLLLRKDLGKMMHFLAGLVLSVWAYRLFLIFVLHVDQGYIYAAFDTRIDHLMIGCLLAVMMRREAMGRLWQALCSSAVLPAVTFGLLVVSAYMRNFVEGYRNAIGFIVEPLLVAVLLVQLVRFSASSAWSWINWSWVRYLGRISYSLYLYQQVTVWSSKRILAGQPVALQLAGAIAVTVLAASGSYFLVERPFLRLKEKYQPLLAHN